MDKYLNDWLRIIEEMKNSNTYKTAWGRGIIECAYMDEFQKNGDYIIMDQASIAMKMIKYYWNQTFFFGLEQGNNPVILQQVKKMIEKYKREISKYPVPWDKVESYFQKDKKYLQKIISAILSNARTNVCPRFLNVSGKETLNIYEINDIDKTLIFTEHAIKTLKEYAFVLSKLLNYKWAQLLERYNTAPNITKKVTAAAERKIKRDSLTKYKKLLLEFYHTQEIRDFYTGEIIDKNDIHIDHVIPWSFIYSNDIWNLVVTKSTTNLQKNNRPPTKADIEKLKDRNRILKDKIKDTSPSQAKVIEYVLNNNIIDKLYVNLRG